MSVVVTTAYLWWQQSTTGTGSLDWTNALLALLMMVFFQAAGNLISDYFDHQHQVDAEADLNGVTWIKDGTFAPREILAFGVVLLGCAAVLGVLLLCRTSWTVAWLGVAGLVLAGFYPWFKYHAMGDYDVLCCYALLPSVGTSYVVTGTFVPFVMLLSLTYGLMTVGILHANNTRDMERDRRAKIRTLAMQLGFSTSRIVYVVEMVVPYLLIVVLTVTGCLSWWTLLCLITLPQAWKLCQTMLKAQEEEQIATLDQQTAQQQLKFSLTLTLIFIILSLVA